MMHHHKLSCLSIGIAAVVGALLTCLLAAPRAAVAMPRVHYKVMTARIDPPWNGMDSKVQGPYCDPTINGSCHFGPYSGQGFAVGVSGHYPLLRWVSLSIAPFIEGRAMYSASYPKGYPVGRLQFGAWAGAEIWYWIWGGRLMVGPTFGAGYYQSTLQEHAGFGLSWCLACSVSEGAGAFRRSLDRVVLKRTGTFSSKSPGVDNFELGLVFVP